MNKLETRYSLQLEIRRQQGDVLWWAYEGIKLRLADKTFYTPDFFVLRHDGELECHETKGFMMDDANVKLKTAAEKFPFRFYLIMLKKGLWDVKEI